MYASLIDASDKFLDLFFGLKNAIYFLIHETGSEGIAHNQSKHWRCVDGSLGLEKHSTPKLYACEDVQACLETKIVKVDPSVSGFGSLEAMGDKGKIRTGSKVG
jgi:hypothetical protein